MSDLINIAIVLLIGTLFSVVAYKLKVSNVFFLILAGMLIGIFEVFDFSNSLIITLSEITLIMVVFDATSKLNFKEVLKFSKDSLRLTLIYFSLTLLVITPIFFYLFELNPDILVSTIIAILFSVLIFGVDPAVALSVLKGKKNRVVETLEIESIINTPITVVFSFLLIGILATKTTQIDYGMQIVSLMQQVFVAIGVGIFAGFLIVRLLRSNYYGDLSHITVITSSIIVYVLCEALNGNGVLGVSVFGLIFGNYRIKHKVELEKFASIFTSTLNILVFVLIGIIITIYSNTRTANELLYGSLLFFIYIFIRYISIELTFKKSLNLKKKIFMSLNVPKGVDVAVIILFVITAISEIEGISVLQNLSLLFILYSIVLTTVSSLFTDYFFAKESKPIDRKVSLKPTDKSKVYLKRHNV